MPYSATNSAFFSRAPGRVPTRNGAVSRRNPGHSAPAGSCGRRTACRGTFPAGRAAKAQSSSQQSIRVLPGSAAQCSPAIASIPRSTREAVRTARRRPTTPDRRTLGTAQSTGKCWAGLRAEGSRSPRPNAPDGIQKQPKSAGTAERPEPASVASLSDDVHFPTDAAASSARLPQPEHGTQLEKRM